MLKFLFAGLSLEAESGSFSLRLSLAYAVVGHVLHLQHQCPVNPKPNLYFSHQISHPVVGQIMYYPILFGCFCKEIAAKTHSLLQIIVWVKSTPCIYLGFAIGMTFDVYDPNSLVN